MVENKKIKESVYDEYPNGWGEQPPVEHVPGQVVIGSTLRSTHNEGRSILWKMTRAGKERVRATTRFEKTIFVAASLAALGGIIGVWGYEYHKKRRRKPK